MLKRIPAILSPELLKVLMEMGHGDELCLADGNFPAAAWAKRLVRLDGHGVPVLLEAVLRYLPLDTFVDHPVAVMQTADGRRPPVWDEYEAAIGKHESAAFGNGFEVVERFAFYERAKQCYAIVATGETALYANVILKKGVIAEP